MSKKIHYQLPPLSLGQDQNPFFFGKLVKPSSDTALIVYFQYTLHILFPQNQEIFFCFVLRVPNCTNGSLDSALNRFSAIGGNDFVEGGWIILQSRWTIEGNFILFV